MKKIFGIVVAVLLSVGQGWAVLPVTIETEYTPVAYFAKCTGVTSCTIDPAGLGSAGYSKNGANLIGFSYAILSVGSDSTFTISVTTRTFSPGVVNPTSFNNQVPGGWYGVAPVISTSTSITAVSGYPLNGSFPAMAVNPVFTFSGLSVAATTYLWCDLGKQKKL